MRLAACNDNTWLQTACRAVVWVSVAFGAHQKAKLKVLFKQTHQSGTQRACKVPRTHGL
jgi:hypothetical protein